MKHDLQSSHFEKLLSRAAAANLMDVSVAYLDRLYHQSDGPPPVYEVNDGERKYQRSDVEAWLARETFFKGLRAAS
ncbi:MAG: hypothetical protein WBG95_08920 [Sulfitobacter sp.]